MSKNSSKEGRRRSKSSWIMKALGRARDLYVSSITSCAGRVAHGSMPMGCHLAIPPTTFSFPQNRYIPSDDDLRQLILASSLSSRHPAVTRSHSVAITRIDEDSPCDFKDHVLVALPRRSFSYAARPRRSSAPVGVLA
ncbi:hypothetical protein J5N97_028471 [Dioscorea zingiberensis]|uniref:Uncharacterized protein n=1 Tax=Dioscorea zingiberensis TaxID=325984 RepID=A0A9D5H4U4_9LILI|nr:hypothetical protein J5N97_028471 [Dioscorea zingiberensis]